MARGLTIRIPIPQKNPPFMHRSKGVGAFLAPSNVPSTRGLGSFFTAQGPAQLLPAPSIFPSFVRKSNGVGAFIAPASYRLPAASVFPQFVRRGLGYVARGRRFPHRGVGDYYDPSFDAFPVYTDLERLGTTGRLLDAETISVDTTPTRSEPTVSDLVAQGYSQADAENLVINRVLGAGAATPSGVSTNAAQTNMGTSATQGVQQASGLPSLGATPTVAPSSLFTSINKWLAGSTTLFGSAWKNSTLLLGGGAGIAGLALLTSMSKGGGRRRR